MVPGEGEDCSEDLLGDFDNMMINSNLHLKDSEYYGVRPFVYLFKYYIDMTNMAAFDNKDKTAKSNLRVVRT